MITKIVVRPGEYHDSVRLMQASQRLRETPGVTEAMLMMATDNNKKILAGAGMADAKVQEAARDDLVIGIVAENEEMAERAFARADEVLRKGASGRGDAHRSLAEALDAAPGSNIALISVPGEYAAAEARDALKRGLNVMLFSDNVALAEEVELKRLAAERGLLLMGPDCGTAIVNGVGLGFANVVRRGRIGVIGASGTGIQEISTQIDRLGLGVSHAIGVGGRDLKPEVGGAAMRQALDLLTKDSGTDVIVLTSKPPDERVAAEILEKASASGKPIVANFLGADTMPPDEANLHFAQTLAGAAAKAVGLAGGDSLSDSECEPGSEVLKRARAEVSRLAPSQRYIRGLFTGGTLCYEALLLLQDAIPVYSNIATDEDRLLSDPTTSHGDTLLDLGDDAFTQGRAHPMIDPQERNRRLGEEAEDESVALLLLDLVLGHGSHENPARELARAVETARRHAGQDGRHLIFVGSVCGTRRDPQGFDEQVAILKEAGVLVADNNLQAALIARAVRLALAEREGKRS